MSETPETDAEEMDGIDCYGEPLKSWDYKSSKDGEVVPAGFARKLERERDEARMERDEARKKLDYSDTVMKWSASKVEELNKGLIRLVKERDEAREELASVRKELVFTNRGAEKNAKINQGLCTRLAEAESERDEAMRELAETISCIEQAIDYHQVHNQPREASVIQNLFENINQRRKHDAR